MILAIALAAATPLTGAWRVEGMDSILLNGTVIPNDAVDDAGHATGIIIYDASGWMALEIGAGGRTPDRVGQTGRQRMIETGSYYAYYGRYEVDLNHHVVRHIIADSLMPPEVGITALRHYRLDGDLLTLTSDPVDRPGGARVNRIVFRRITGASPTTTATGPN